MKLNKTTKAMLLAVAATAFTSCASDDLINSNKSSQNAIDFSTYVKTNSRAQVTYDSVLKADGFKVMAVKTSKEISTSYDEAYNEADYNYSVFMKDVKVSYEDNAWTYSPVQYWPNTTDVISFCAYGPANKVADTDADIYNAEIKYNLLSNSGSMTEYYDLITAKQLNQSRTTNMGKVSFDFKHATSRIDVKAKLTSKVTGTYVYITDLKISGNKLYTSGTYDMVSNTWIEEENTPAGKTEYSLGDLLNKKTDETTGVNGVVLKQDGTTFAALFKNSSAAKLVKKQYFFAIPYDDKDAVNTREDYVVTVEYAIATENGAVVDGNKCYNIVEGLSTKLDIKTILKQGNAYCLNLEIDPAEQQVSFATMTIDAWDDVYLDNKEVEGNIDDSGNKEDNNQSSEDASTNIHYYLVRECNNADWSFMWNSEASCFDMDYNADGTYSITLTDDEKITTSGFYIVPSEYPKDKGFGKDFYYWGDLVLLDGSCGTLKIGKEYEVTQGLTEKSEKYQAGAPQYIKIEKDVTNPTVVFNPSKKTVKVTGTVAD